MYLSNILKIFMWHKLYESILEIRKYNFNKYHYIKEQNIIQIYAVKKKLN